MESKDYKRRMQSHGQELYEYKQLTRKRNAIEGIPSVLRRRYHVDDIPVFGYLRSRQFFLFKVGAYNFNKLLKHNRRTRGESAQNLAMA